MSAKKPQGTAEPGAGQAGGGELEVITTPPRKKQRRIPDLTPEKFLPPSPAESSPERDHIRTLFRRMWRAFEDARRYSSDSESDGPAPVLGLQR